MTTLTTEQLQSLDQYTKLRDAVRNGVQHGVYPNLVATIAAYDALEAALASELAEWQPTHAESMANVTEHVAALRAGMEQIAAGLEQIAAVDPLVFPAITAAMAQAPVEDEPQ